MELNQKKVGLTKGSSKTLKNHQNAEVKHKVEIIFRKKSTNFIYHRSQHIV